MLRLQPQRVCIPIIMFVMLALRPPAHRLRRRQNLNLIATKGSDLMAAMRIAADSQIARRIYRLLAVGTHFSTQTTWMVPWLSYA